MPAPAAQSTATSDIQTPVKSRRITSIDLFRGGLLCIMVVEHFLLYYGDATAMDNWFYCLVNDGIAGWGAGGFLMMMGASQALSAKRLDTDNATLLKKALLRGAFLFGTGLVMLLLAFGPGDLWRWDILTLIGFSTVLLYFCRFLPTWIILAGTVCIIFLTPVLRGLPMMDFGWEFVLVETPVLSSIFPGMYWDPTHEPEFHRQFGHIVKGFFFWGEFPIFPWLIFSLLGFVAGRRIVGGRFESDIPKVVATGMVLIAVAFALAYLGSAKPPESIVGDFIAPFSFYPDSFPMILYQVGMTILVFSLLFYVFDVRGRETYRPGGLGRILKRTSDFSLTFYFLHYMLLGWPMLLYYAKTGRNPEMDFMGLLPSLVCGCAALLMLQLLIFRWEKAKSKYSFEWMLAALTRRVVPGYEKKRAN